MSEEAPLFLSRRNGRPVACVPCRARKVACDHHRPVCHRCRRRGQANLCRYPEATVSSVNDADLDSFTPFERPRPNYTQPSAQPGYMGYTSFSNVFEETESQLASLLGSSPSTYHEHTPTEKVGAKTSFRDLPVPLRETCLLLLRCLPGQRNEQFRYLSGASEPLGWAYMAVDGIIQSLQLTYGDTLSQGEAGLRTMTEILCNNTRQRIRDDIDDPVEWIGQFCGQNLRWESIGLLWAHLSRISDILDSLRSRSLEWIEGKESPQTSRTCLERSIHIARHFTDTSDVLLDLLKRKTTLISTIDGDMAYSTMSSHGIAVAMLTYRGLHAIEPDPSYKPTLCSEYKRRIFAQLYNSDKLGTAFTGRPPLLNRRYCSTPLPLDLPDDVLIADETTLDNAVNALDDNGWNTEGEIHSATILRARCLFAYVYDALFEVALARDGRDRSALLFDIRERARMVRDGFPESLKYRPGDPTDPSVDTRTLYIRIIIQLAYLQIFFFVERLLHRFGVGDEGDLVATSYELVSVTLKMWVHKDRLSNAFMLRNFDWLLMAHGAPAGGILCQELLSPTFSGVHPKHAELTRSSIVQQLSLLVGFLDWIPETAPNGKQCDDAKATIQRILDQHLNAPSGQNLADNIDWEVMAQPNFTFDLLNTFDWMQSDIQ